MVLPARIFSGFYNKGGRNGWDSAAFGIVEKSKSFDFPTNADDYVISPNTSIFIIYLYQTPIRFADYALAFL